NHRRLTVSSLPLRYPTLSTSIDDARDQDFGCLRPRTKLCRLLAVLLAPSQSTVVRSVRSTRSRQLRPRAEGVRFPEALVGLRLVSVIVYLYLGCSGQPRRGGYQRRRCSRVG